MTTDTENTTTEGQESLLPVPLVDISQLRVTRAELAKFLDCSKQTTGEWARKGIVTFADYDQRVSLKDALRQVMARGNLKWLRVRALRDLALDTDALRQRITELERQISEMERDAERSVAATTLAAKHRYEDELARGLYSLQRELIAHFSVLVAGNRRGDLANALDRMVDAVFYPDFDTTDEASDAVDDAADTMGDSPAPSSAGHEARAQTPDHEEENTK